MVSVLVSQIPQTENQVTGPMENKPEVPSRVSFATKLHVLLSALLFCFLGVYLVSVLIDFWTRKYMITEDQLMCIELVLLVGASGISLLVSVLYLKRKSISRKTYRLGSLLMYVSMVTGGIMYILWLAGGMNCAWTACPTDHGFPVDWMVGYAFPAASIILSFLAFRAERTIYIRALWSTLILIGLPILFFGFLIRLPMFLQYTDSKAFREKVLNGSNPAECLKLKPGILQCLEKFGLNSQVCQSLEPINSLDNGYVAAECYKEIGDCSKSFALGPFWGSGCYVREAVKTGDPHYCETLLAQAGKSDASQCYRALATSTTDMQFCQKIQSVDTSGAGTEIQAQCYIDLAKLKDNSEYCQAIQELALPADSLALVSCYVNLAQLSGKTEYCAMALESGGVRAAKEFIVPACREAFAAYQK